MRSIAALLVLAMLGASALPVRAEEPDVAIGERLFRRSWTVAPASARANDGLGPLFNARSCAACHQGLERADIHAPDVTERGLVVRLSDPAGAGDPTYGRQIQTSAAPGLAPEARVSLQWRVVKAGLAQPFADLTDLSAGPLAGSTIATLRTAPALKGLGAVEAVADDAIEALADPDDRDGDGISGRVARLVDGRVGRFGWKATQASIEDQVAAAFHLDLGLSSASRPDPAGDCTPAQTECLAAPAGAEPDGVEISPPIIDLISAFLRAAPSPAPIRDAAGERLFRQVGCAACHVEALRTQSGGFVTLYSDLLLHDMGEELAAGGPEGAASAREWRTTPLRGVASAQKRGLLHDGRASSLEDAIRWHGGEADISRQRALALAGDERKSLIRFLEGL